MRVSSTGNSSKWSPGPSLIFMLAKTSITISLRLLPSTLKQSISTLQNEETSSLSAIMIIMLDVSSRASSTSAHARTPSNLDFTTYSTALTTRMQTSNGVNISED